MWRAAIYAAISIKLLLVSPGHIISHCGIAIGLYITQTARIGLKLRGLSATQFYINLSSCIRLTDTMPYRANKYEFANVDVFIMLRPMYEYCQKYGFMLSFVRFVSYSTWWRHQMETFSALLAICAGNSPVTGEVPAQRPVTRNFEVFFDMRLNKRLSKQWWGWRFETPSRPVWHHWNGALWHSWIFHTRFYDCWVKSMKGAVDWYHSSLK